MVSLEDGDVGGEQLTHRDYGHLLFPTCLLTRTLTLSRPCTLAFALAPLSRSRPRIAPNLPLALHQMPTFGVVGTFAPSTAEPRPRTPRMAPALRLRQTPVLDLDFVPAFTVHRASTTRAPSSHFCLPLFTVHLACTVSTSVLHASRASPPHPLSLHPMRSSYQPSSSYTSALLQVFRLLIWGCILRYQTIPFLPLPPCSRLTGPGPHLLSQSLSRSYSFMRMRSELVRFLLPRSRFMHVLLEVVRVRAIRLFVDLRSLCSLSISANAPQLPPLGPHPHSILVLPASSSKWRSIRSSRPAYCSSRSHTFPHAP
ncbi:hypothetical protein B0H13DRAFT_2324401 [Mycena leptocephala]|nr:hypothetical protein B0H13DRAFT_2324401 [Mycena leptocephala]